MLDKYNVQVKIMIPIHYDVVARVTMANGIAEQYPNVVIFQQELQSWSMPK